MVGSKPADGKLSSDLPFMAAGLAEVPRVLESILWELLKHERNLECEYYSILQHVAPLAMSEKSWFLLMGSQQGFFFFFLSKIQFPIKTRVRYSVPYLTSILLF